MAITAGQVNELREMTGAGMMECKKALTETNGDMEASVEWLRKNGAMKAVKKASRIAAEGLCFVKSEDDKKAAVVEVNSETDFVAQNEKFRAYVDQVAAQALHTSAKDLDAFLAEPWEADNAKTVNDALVEMIAVISEKLSSAVSSRWKPRKALCPPTATAAAGSASSSRQRQTMPRMKSRKLSATLPCR